MTLEDQADDAESDAAYMEQMRQHLPKTRKDAVDGPPRRSFHPTRVGRKAQ